MELRRHASDLTDTSKRALVANRGKSETLKSTYETLECEYKTKCSNLSAEQARFVRLMRNKLPAIKVSNDDESRESTCPHFLTAPNSPLAERQNTMLPALISSRRRSKSFSDLSQALGVPEEGKMVRQKSVEQLEDKLTEQRTSFSSTRPRSLSAIVPPSRNFPVKCRNDDEEGEKLFRSRACSANQQSSITLTGTNGAISTNTGGGWPARWLPMNATCQWTVTAPVGKVFRIHVWVKFNVKQACSDDYVRIYDGPSTASDIMAEFKCTGGTVYVPYFYSSSRSFLLEAKTGLVANSTIIHVIEYQAHVKQECSINSTLDAPQFPTERSFSSPYFPHGYRMNMTCGWYITAPKDHIVKFSADIKVRQPDEWRQRQRQCL
ncbi:hypothetical protein OS493_029625 [Desmophyllum pertusum]|uniref:CUB domain-containing protein n=1 Tax=Desmophyllum pertusum TaxID=174260 RepID=A0A9W9ZYE7_9CNID|nr:hypothetical protein OS493_029625 [Desmophyllum pertusum]